MALDIAAALLVTISIVGVFKLGMSLIFGGTSEYVPQLWHRLLGLVLCLLATAVSFAIVLTRL